MSCRHVFFRYSEGFVGCVTSGSEWLCTVHTKTTLGPFRVVGKGRQSSSEVDYDLSTLSTPTVPPPDPDSSVLV